MTLIGHGISSWYYGRHVKVEGSTPSRNTRLFALSIIFAPLCSSMDSLHGAAFFLFYFFSCVLPEFVVAAVAGECKDDQVGPVGRRMRSRIGDFNLFIYSLSISPSRGMEPCTLFSHICDPFSVPSSVDSNSPYVRGQIEVRQTRDSRFSKF